MCEKWLGLFVLMRGFTKNKKVKNLIIYSCRTHFLFSNGMNETNTMCPRWLVMRQEWQPTGNTEKHTACRWLTYRDILVFEDKNSLEKTFDWKIYKLLQCVIISTFIHLYMFIFYQSIFNSAHDTTTFYLYLRIWIR